MEIKQIKQSELTEEEKQTIQSYFGELPKFHFYALSKFEDADYIDMPKFAEEIIEAFKIDDTKLGGKFSFIDNENYIATIVNRNNLYHEVTHLIFYDKIADFFKDKKIDGRKNLIDEIIAEYHSTKIRRKSDIYMIKIKRNRELCKRDVPYLIGAYLAYSDMESEIIKNAPALLIEKAKIVKDALEIGKTSFKIIDYDLLIQLFKHKKTAP